MAGLTVQVNSSASISTTTSRKCVLQYTAPANTGAVIEEVYVSYEGVSPTQAKVLTEIVKGATSGTGTSVSPVKLYGHTGSVQGTGKEDFGAGTQPSGGTVADVDSTHPQGFYRSSKKIVLNPGETISIFATSANSLGSRSRIRVEE